MVSLPFNDSGSMRHILNKENKVNSKSNGFLKTKAEEQWDDDEVDVADGDISIPSHTIDDFDVPLVVKKRLFDHQIAGVEWLYGLHLSRPGGILGDDMGLGK